MHRRLAQNLASASRPTGLARLRKARLRGSPCSSKDGRAALACRALHRPVRAPHRENCGAIRASATATKARLPGSPWSSKDAGAALACRALHQPVRALHRENCAATIRATNAISARVGRQHQTRPALRLRRVPHRVHSAMKAEEMCGERSLGGISAA
jgi:HD superfamily phosphodiesterase